MSIFTHTKTDKKSGKKYTYYIVDAGSVNGKRIRKSFKDMKEAKAYERTFKRQRDRFGELSTALSVSQMAIATNAFQLMSNAGILESELLSIVDEAIERRKAVTASVSIDEAYKEYAEMFNTGKQREHLKTVRCRVGKFVAHIGFDTPIVNVATKNAEDFMKEIALKNDSERTFNNYLSYIKSFFNWCMERKYIAENPFINIKSKAIGYEDPTFIKVEHLQAALAELETCKEISKADRTLFINFITLSFFCGMRSSEIFRLPPSAVHPEDAHPFARVSKGKGAERGRKGRIVDLEANAVAWLDKYPFRKKINEDLLYKVRLRVCELNPSIFEPLREDNIGRHSYISYHTAKYRDYARTEAYVATSSNMRVKHYQGLATTSAGEAYFNLFPSS